MSDIQFYTMNLKSKIISLEKTVESYRSSQKYEELKQKHKGDLKKKETIIQSLKQEIQQDSLHHKKAIHEWIKVCDEMHHEHQKELIKKDKEIEKWKALNQKLYEEVNNLYEQERKNITTIQTLQNQLDTEQGKNLKLIAQVNKDYENSSKPSSASPYRKKIVNSREKSGKKPGGQKGHQGHERKQYQPTKIIQIETPSEYLDTTKYVATGKMIKKQVVNVSFVIEVTEYQALEFRSVESRQKVHGVFPTGISNEVNFGASVQALAFLLNNHYHVSIGKTQEFLHELSDGVFSMSKGCINQLSKRFAQKTKPEQEKIYDDLVKAPVLNTDFTTARVNGKLRQVLICATPNGMMYYARKHKGHKGIEGSPVEHSVNLVVHDHDVTLYAYGGAHQECLVHVIRYLRSSMENESHLSWNKRMYDTIRKMIHYVKHHEVRDEKVIEKLIRDYDRNLEIAELNYKEHPPTKYFRDGYNLAKRMRVYRESHLQFLFMAGVPYDNNLCERLARVIKRKLRQMTTFRSDESLEDVCACLGIIESFRSEGGNLLEKVSEVFEK